MLLYVATHSPQSLLIVLLPEKVNLAMTTAAGPSGY
jgi:hypothetical protein